MNKIVRKRQPTMVVFFDREVSRLCGIYYIQNGVAQ